MGYVYEVEYKGTLTIHSDKELTDDEVEELAEDVVHSDAYTRLHHHCGEYEYNIIDVDEEED